MRLLISGAYTIHSAGDDAALEALLRLVRTAVPGQPVSATVVCRHPNRSFERAFGVAALGNLEYATRQESVGRWLRGFNPGDDLQPLLALAGAVNSADAVVLGAGNFLNQNSFGLFRGMLPQFAVLTFLAGAAGVPVMLYGLSASPLTDPLAVRMAQWLLDTASVVTFREKDSVQVLRRSGVRVPRKSCVLADPVLAASAAPLASAVRSKLVGLNRTPRRPCLGVSLRSFHHLGEAAHRAYVHRMISVVREWKRAGGDVLLIPQCTYDIDGERADDRCLNAQVAAAAGGPDAVAFAGGQPWPWQTEALYGLCDVALCSRLHAGVFAVKQGTPAVALGYEAKVTGFWRSLGLGHWCVPLETSPSVLIAKLRSARTDFPRERGLRAVAAAREKCGAYAKLLVELVARKRGKE